MFENLEFKKPDGDLSFSELKKLTSFFMFLTQNKFRAKIIFRGDNYSNFKDKLNLYDDDNYQKLNSFLFLIGEKGRVFRNEYKKKISNKNKIYAIDYAGADLYNSIFKKLNYLFTKKKSHSEIQHFKSDNIDFFNYFSEVNNKSDFLEIINSIEDNNKKIAIRDYYLSLLHKIGEIGFYNNSFFVSATSDYKTAIDFSKKISDSERLIIISWITFPMKKSGITVNYLNKSKEFIESIGLPIYKNPFYPRQKEISIKGGLLPHYILGYIKLRKKEFIVNPNLFSDRHGFKEIMRNGFDIDQSIFHNALSETDYSGFIFIDEDGEMYDWN